MNKPLHDHRRRAFAESEVRRFMRAVAAESLLAFGQLYLPHLFKQPPSRMHLELADLLQRASRREGVPPAPRTPVDPPIPPGSESASPSSPGEEEPPADMSGATEEPTDQPAPARGERIAVAAPRGHAKSTLVSQAYVLWSLCYQREQFIVLISNTGQQAEEMLEHIKTELLSNDALRRDFPEVCDAVEGRGSGQGRGRGQARRRGARLKPSRWTKQEIVSAAGARVLALGAGMQLRGRRHRALRPTLIIVDDLENEESVHSRDLRTKAWQWFTKTVLNAGQAGTNVFVIGTLLHADSLLARLVDPDRDHAWTKRVYRAVEMFSDRTDLWGTWEAIGGKRSRYQGLAGKAGAARFFADNRGAMLAGTQVLWPQREDYLALMLTKFEQGKYAFKSEKQNDPISSEDSLLAGNGVTYWDDHYRSPGELFDWIGHDNLRFYAGCDPGLSPKPGRGDPSAIVIVARDRRDNSLYVVEADIQHRDPAGLVRAMMHWAQKYPFSRVIIESNGFQRMLVSDMERQARLLHIDLTIKEQVSRSPKHLRIQSMQPMLNCGQLQLCRRLRELNEQLERFPLAKHDDGPDALQMVAEYAQDPKDGVGWVNL